MTLPVVPANPMSFSQINTELSQTSTGFISLNDTNVRSLAGVGANPAQIAITNLSGKSSTISFSGFNTLTAYNGSTSRGESYAVAVNNSGVIVATGFITAYPNSHGSYTRSTDGSTWTTPALINGSTTIANMVGITTATSGKFVAVGYDPNTNNGGAYYATSTDGSTWTSPASMGSANMQAVCYNPTAGRLVAVGDNGSYQAFSYSDNNGSTWSTVAFNTSIFGMCKAVCWNPVLNMYAAVGRGYAGYPFWITSTNGVSWTTPVTFPTIRGSLFGIVAMSSGRFVAVGSTVSAGGGGIATYAYSDNGTTWTHNYVNTSSTTTDLFAVAINGLNQMVAVGYNGATGHPCWTVSSNGTSWSAIADLTTGTTYGSLNGIATRTDGKFVATGYNANGGNGYQWYVTTN